MYQLSEEQRLDFYLGSLANSAEILPAIELSKEIITGRPCYFKKSYFKNSYFEKNTGLEAIKPIFRTDIERLLTYAKRDQLCFLCGDAVYSGGNYPVLVKTRDSHDEKANGIISNIQSGRHWDLSFPDIPWEEKQNDFCWRGADTGRVPHDNQRICFVEKYFSPRVGFSLYEQNHKRSPERYVEKFLIGLLPKSELMQYKYQLVLEGNDKASNLNWVLLSNSTPIMSRPKYHSWLCEKYLVPGVHYVEVAQDFSDFEEKLAWCKANDEAAKKIAVNGKRFVEQFLSTEKEAQIEKKLIERVEQLYEAQ